MNFVYESAKKIRNVLFVCDDNARHSLIAEALLRGHGMQGLRAFSAGLEPADRADSYTLSALILAGLGHEGLWPKHWDGFADPKRMLIDQVVMIGDGPIQNLPRRFPGNPEYIAWQFTGDQSLRFHHGVWRDIQILRPYVEGLVDDLCYKPVSSQNRHLTAVLAE